MSHADVIMSIQEIIDASFGVDTTCVVNFKMLKSLLLILGNQLRILDRYVQFNSDDLKVTSNMSVSEVTVQANDNKVKKKPEKIITKSESYIKKDEVHEVQASDKKVKKKPEKISTKSESYIKKEDEVQKVQASDKKVKKKPEQISTKSESYLKKEDEVHGRVLEAMIEEECRSASNIDILTEEEKRERLLRTIEQRHDSRVDPVKTPTPMASMDSLCRAKILLVGAQGRAPRLSVVTNEEFGKLYAIVHELQAQLDPKRILKTDNAEIIQSVRQGASLTDAMTALATSAKLEGFNKALGITFSLMTELAKNTTGVDIAQFKAVENEFKAKGEVDASVIPQKQAVVQETPVYVTDCVTATDLKHAMEELQEDVIENVKQIASSTKSETSKTIRSITDLENKTQKALEVAKRFEIIEKTVEDYGKRLSALDTNLSTQITHYQDELTQMQHELETGLDTLEQTLNNLATNPDDIVDLSRNLNAVHDEMENSSIKQRDLEIFQARMATDMAEMCQQLELIREVKADRSEVHDSLCDKAGIEQLNGMVSMDILNACRDDLLNKIQEINDTFKNQQEVWQKAIDDLVGSIDEKSDWHQLHRLRDDIGYHLNVLQNKVQDLSDLVGEPRAVALKKILFRDTECISCRQPARMEVTVPQLPLLPSFKRASADGAEATKPQKGGGDNKTCYVSQPAKHPMHAKAHMCHRYCGGSHTILPAGCNTRRAVAVAPYQRELTTTIGTDGFTYRTDEIILPKPCVACNAPASSPSKNNERESFDPAEQPNQELSMLDVWDMAVSH